MFKFGHYKLKFVGFILILALMVPAYVTIVEAVQQFNNRSLIDQLSLFSSSDTNETTTQFHAGEILSIRARVREADAYYVTFLSNNGQVYFQNGRINSSAVAIQVPLNPPSFRANESYVLIFSAIISVYPIPGAFVTDKKIAAFQVISADTKLYLTSVYDDNSHNLALRASLKTEDGSSLANKTIEFFLQLNSSAYARNRGWSAIANAKTDANGSISLLMGSKLFGGMHYIKAAFEGDNDFGKSENLTKYYTALRVPHISITKLSNLVASTNVSIRVVDDQGYPLFGKMLAVDFGGSYDLPNSEVLTDEKGEVALSFQGLKRLMLNQSIFRIREDMFTSELSISFPTLVSIKNQEAFSAISSASYSARSGYSASTPVGSLTVTPYPANPYAILEM